MSTTKHVFLVATCLAAQCEGHRLGLWCSQCNTHQQHRICGG